MYDQTDIVDWLQFLLSKKKGLNELPVAFLSPINSSTTMAVSEVGVCSVKQL